MKTCIVSFANSDSARYMKNLQRLQTKLSEFAPHIPFLGFTSYELIGSPKHHELNYGFKIFAIRKALEAGYTKIIWADSAIYPVKPIDNFLDCLKERGALFFENVGHNLGFWSSDACLDYYGVKREVCFEQPQIMGCLFALDFEKGVTIDFWSRYEKDATNPKLANGAWTNEALQVSKDALVNGHRHDQTIASFILNSMNYELLNPMQTFLAYAEWYKRFNINETVCFNSQSY